jgi:folate-binding protein YgfZ
MTEERPLAPLLHAPLPRAVLRVAGPDRESFLQGLVSNDVRRVAPDRALFAALLSAQGRFLHDFHIAAADLGDEPAWLLDPEAARAADLLRRLKLYRLRAKVEIEDLSDRFSVHALFGPGAATAAGLPAEPGAARIFAGGVLAVDARDPALGVRAILPRETAGAALDGLGEPAPFEAWDRHRLALGIPDGSRDLPVDKALLMESGYDALHAIDWKKGCYVGQELTARTKYRGLVKRALLPVAVDGPMPEAGAPVEAGGTVVGEMRSGRDGLALALLRLGTEGPMSAGDAAVTLRPRPS